MTKHVDAKLLGEHVRCTGCEFAAGRAELAPQIVQEVQDVVDSVEDEHGELPGGLMTAPLNEQSATQENRCAAGSETCLPPGMLDID